MKKREAIKNAIMKLSAIKSLVFVLAAFMLMTAFTGCGKADISAYADEEINITGLLDEDFTVTPGELAEMECVSATAVGETEKAGKVKAYGPTLDTFLEHYGVSKDDLYSIKCYAKDDYKVTLGKVTWDSKEVILSIAYGSEAFDEKTAPLRIVIPEGQSGNWIRMVNKMEFTYKDE